MADLNRLMVVPAGMVSFEPSSAAFNGIALDGSSDKFAYKFQAATTDAITGVVLHIDRIDGTPPTYKVGLQSLDASGDPSGTFLGGGSEASTTFAPEEADQDTLKEITFDNSYTPSLGEELAAVVEYSSGTVDSSNDATINYRFGWIETLYPTGTYNTGSTWIGSAALCPNGIVAGSTRYGHPLLLAGSSTVSVSGRRAAGRFSLPSGSTTTYKLAGIACYPSATGDFKVGVWEGTTEKASKTITGNADSSDRGGHYLFSSSVELTAGTEYRIGIEHTGDGCDLGYFDCQSSTFADHWGGYLKLSTYDGSSWTDDDSLLAMAWPIFEDMTCSGGGTGGGALINGGLVRG